MKQILLFVVMFSLVLTTRAQDIQPEAAMNLVLKNSEKIGLSEEDLKQSVISSAYHNTFAGTDMVYLQQTHLGIPVYNSIQTLAFKNGALVSAQGNRIKNVRGLAGLNGMPSVTVQNALITALQQKGAVVTGPVSITETKGSKMYFGTLGVAFEDIFAELIWIPVKEKSTVELAWQFFYAPLKSSDYWLIRINAFDNSFINETNLTIYCQFGHSHNAAEPMEDACSTVDAHPSSSQHTASPDQTQLVNTANYHIIPYPAESRIHPGGTPTAVSNPWNLFPGNATTLGWHNDGSFDFWETRGNNVYAQEDRDDNNSTFGQSAQSSTSPDPLNFIFIPDFTVTPTQTSPVPNQQFNITNLFYWNNIAHNLSYVYGFAEVNGNFQNNNQGRGGAGNDYVIADAQDAGGVNNANFATPPDGTRPRMQMYLWGSGIQRDGSTDNGIVVHEFAHGISNRLTGGPNQASCLTNEEQMGEGWSDYFTLMYTQDWANANLNTGFTSPRGIGTFASGQTVNGSGIRNRRYTTNFAINNLTYSTFVSSQQHTRGELWCATLWDMTWNIINQVGVINPNFTNPNAPGGNSIAMRLVMEGMKLQQCNPGFISGRDAILAADQILFNGAYQCSIWEAFRRRGMGFYANEGSTDDVNDQTPDNSYPVYLSLSQGGVTEVEEGQLITYVNTVSSPCGPISNYILRDTLPANVTYVSGGTYNSTTRVVSFDVNQAAGVTQDYPFVVRVNTGAYFPTVTLFEETVPNSTLGAGWVSIGTPTANTWVTSTTFSSSPTRSFYARNFNVSTDMRLERSVNINLPANSTARLKFSHRFLTESGWDGGVVEASVNNGTTWFDIGSGMIEGRYNGAIGNASTNVLSNRPAFTGLANSFFSTVVNLTQLAGQNMRFRFRFGSDDNSAPSTTSGWYVDDISVINQPWVNMRTSLFNGLGIRVDYADTSALVVETVTCNDVAITTQPVNVTVCAGSNAVFTVAVSGTAPTYQWQVSTDGGNTWGNIPTATTATLTLTGVTAGQNNTRYRVITGNTCPSSVTSTGVTLTVNNPAAITTQPVNQSVCSGNNTSFSVTASGTGLAYQWQVSIDGGANWTDLTGATSSTLNINGATVNLNGNRYRAIVTGCSGAINSAAVTLTVLETASILTAPSNVNACSGTDAVFSVSAAGTNITYQWQVSTDGGNTWSNVSGANTATFTIPAVTGPMNNNRVRVIVSNTCAGSLTSSAAILTVSVAAAITTQPANATVCSGNNTSFSVSATGSNNTYQWQVSTDGGNTWNNITGATGVTLNINNAAASLNNNRYRVVVTSCSGALSSNAAVLTVNESASITTQPANVNACSGSDAVFSVTAAGQAVTYQWQVSTNGGTTWNNVPGATAAVLTVPAVDGSLNNNRYRVVLDNACTSNLISNPAILTVSVAATITAQPQSATVCAGENTAFNVTATGTANSYQWQVSTNGGTTWNNITGATFATLSLNSVDATFNGLTYRVVVTSCAGALNSGTATLTVNSPVSITTQPVDVTACTGNDAVFNIALNGTNPSIQWQVSTDGGTTWNNVPGATATTLTVSNLSTSDNGNRYRVVLSNICTTNLTSSVATLTISATAAIGTQPVNTTVCAGTNASFSVAATGSGLGYQWQVSTDGGNTWNDITGATAANLTLNNVSITDNGNTYRVLVTSCSPGVITSSAANLEVNAAATITTQPVAAAACPGGDVSFTVTASGISLTYQWQVSTDGGTTWNTIAGATGTTLNVNAVTAGMNNNRYRVLVNGVCTTNLPSDAAVLTVTGTAAVTTQPSNNAGCSGSDVDFSVQATNALSYQWQVSTDGGTTWTDVTGATSATYSATGVDVNDNNNQYRVVINGACNTVTSNAATLTVNPLPVVTANGPATAVCSGSAVTLSGNGASTYTWNNGVTNGIAFNINNTTTYTVTGTDANGCTSSDNITVTVNPVPNVVINTTNTSVEEGSTTTLTASATPATTTFTWLKNGGVVPGETGNTLVVSSDEVGTYTATAEVNGCTGTSNTLIITLAEPNFSFITPNPNNGVFQVRVRNTAGNTPAQRLVAVYDAKGSRVYAKYYTSNPGTSVEVMQVDMRNVAAGNYMLVLMEDGKFIRSAQVHVNRKF
ncbi:MAG TPA: M36 family metallopeptidase [Ferruginibacter sp.]|nr:M36 family metallopeptidase [Ferruginibacter sp.]HRQ19664.1 M36 family metallopeptidase [Ferruginibacter sp.]